MNSKLDDQSRIRYSVRASVPGRRPIEVSVGAELDEQIRRAKKYNARTGRKTWLWRTKDGVTLLELPARPSDPEPLATPRHCGYCKREFDFPSQYMSSKEGGIVCRSRKQCMERMTAKSAGGAK